MIYGSIRLWGALLVIASLGCGLAGALVTYGANYPTHLLIATAIGGGALPALVPIIWLAFVRFRVDRAAGPLVLWTILVVVLSASITTKYVATTEPSPIGETTICPSFSDFCVKFPQEPDFKLVDLANQRTEGQLSGYRYELVVDRSNTYLRAEFTPFQSPSQFVALTDSELREIGAEFAQHEGLRQVEVFSEHKPIGRTLVVRGTKQVDGLTVEIFNHTYHGPNGALHLVAAGSASSFPTVASKKFLGSVTARN